MGIIYFLVFFLSIITLTAVFDSSNLILLSYKIIHVISSTIWNSIFDKLSYEIIFIVKLLFHHCVSLIFIEKMKKIYKKKFTHIFENWYQHIAKILTPDLLLGRCWRGRRRRGTPPGNRTRALLARGTIFERGMANEVREKKWAEKG